MRIKQTRQRRLALGLVFQQLGQLAVFGHRPTRNQPAQRAPEVEHGVDGRQLPVGLFSQRLRLVDFADVGVGQVGHLGNRVGGQLQALHFALLKQRAQRVQAALHHLEALALQAVAGLQMVVKKAERRADGEGVQPQRGLGQLHRHGVLVHPEDGFLQDHAAHDVAVVQLRVGHRPAVGGGVLLDGAANLGNAPQHRALPGAAGLGQVRRPGLGVDAFAGAGHGFQHAVGQKVDQRHQKVAAAHGGVANLQLQQLAGGVDRGHAGIGVAVERLPLGVGQRGALLPAGQALLERGLLLARQQAHRFAQHQAHQVVVRVIAARYLARKAGGLRHQAVDFGLVLVVVLGLHFVHQRVFEQALVNAAQVRDGQVAVVDPAARDFFGAARQRVDDGRHHLVGHVGALQQGRAAAVEQAAVVGGHADGVVALVDQQENALQLQPDMTERARKRRPRVHPVAHVLADAAHAVFGVALVAHGQQVAVFGVEQKQQAVQQDQRGFAHFIQVGRRELRPRELAVADGVGLRMQIGLCQRIGQLGKHVVEHALAQVLCHLLLVQPCLGLRVGVQGAAGRIPVLRQKGSAAEEQQEQAQGVVGRGVVKVALRAGHAQGDRQVELKKLFGARAGVLPVQAPHGAIGQHAPLDAAVAHHIGAAQIAQHLRRGRVGVLRLGGVAPVERPQPALGLQQGDAVAQALLVFRQGERLLFGLPVGKQQPVGHVLAALGRQVDLRQRAVVPTQRAQHGGDQLGLGLRFVEGRVGVAPAEHRVQAGAEAGHRLIGEGLPGGRFAHAAQQKVL